MRRVLTFELVCTINNGDCEARWSMSFCLLICMDNLLGMNQTKHLIRSIIMIITIIKIKNKTRKGTPSLIINSLTHVCVSGRNNFFLDLLIFHKDELLKCFKVHNTLIMTWVVEEHCLEINIILIQYMTVWLYIGTSIRQVNFRVDTSVYFFLEPWN